MKQDYCVHPGELMDSILLSMGKTQRWLAQKMGVNKTIINEIINAKRSVTAMTASKFEDVTGVNAIILLKQQDMYDLFCLEKSKINTWSCKVEQNIVINVKCEMKNNVETTQTQTTTPTLNQQRVRLALAA